MLVAQGLGHLHRQMDPKADGHLEEGLGKQTGYYYAQTAGEVYSTIRNLKKMRSGLDAAITGLEQSLHSFAGDRG